MRQILRTFTMREISAVDRPAQAPAKMVLIKRGDAMLYTSIEKGDLPDDVLTYLKREFSAEERQRAAESGAALPDGSFPIENAVDLHNAMRAIGRAKDPEKAKAHIRARARALGLEDRLSDAFKRAPLLEKFMALFRKEQAPVAAAVIEQAVTALAESVASIVGDTAGEKTTALGKTFAQFHEFLIKAVGAGTALASDKDHDMDTAALKKALGLADSSTDAELSAAIIKVASTEKAAKDAEIAKLKSDLAIVKAAMTDEEKNFHDGLKGDDEKEKFRGLSRDERKERMKKRDDLPADVRKALIENDELKKRLAALEDGKELDALSKRATEAGMPAADGATIQKALRGDKEAVGKLVDVIKAQTAQIKAAGLFKEIGGTGTGATVSAYEELMAKADELRKKETSLTREQAFAKIYADPANAELAKRERGENRPAAA